MRRSSSSVLTTDPQHHDPRHKDSTEDLHRTDLAADPAALVALVAASTADMVVTQTTAVATTIKATATMRHKTTAQVLAPVAVVAQCLQDAAGLRPDR